jgi:CheY-like chemotaxis protein
MNEIPHNILSGWKVVVIDDEADSLHIAELILHKYQAEVHTASNGDMGLRLIEAVRPRFVITDLSMPVMDGWELMTAIQARPELNGIPVIALTAHAMLGDREKALAAGFYNYITKPFTARSFIENLLILLVEVPEFAGELDWTPA